MFRHLTEAFCLLSTSGRSHCWPGTDAEAWMALGTLNLLLEHGKEAHKGFDASSSACHSGLEWSVPAPRDVGSCRWVPKASPVHVDVYLFDPTRTWSLWVAVDLNMNIDSCLSLCLATHGDGSSSGAALEHGHHYNHHHYKGCCRKFPKNGVKNELVLIQKVLKYTHTHVYIFKYIFTWSFLKSTG